jgi:hypothetical protein
MTTDKKTVSTVDAPSNHLSLFSLPLLLKGEDPESYNQLLAGVKGNVVPTDFLEEIWTNEVVQETWEIVRWRRLKSALLNSAMPDAIEKLLVKRSLKSLPEAKKLAEAWAGAKSSDVKEVDDLLASAGITIDDVQARALELKFKDIDGLDGLIISAKIRLSATLREIDLHRNRKQFAKDLQAEIIKIEDSELAITTAPQQPSSKPSLLPP